MTHLCLSRAVAFGTVAFCVLGLGQFSNRGLADQTAPPPSGKVFDLYQRSEAEARTLAALDEPTEIEFTDTPLNEAANFLGELHDIVIVLDQSALAEAGIAPDTPITRVLSRVALQKALNLMLEPLGLTYVVANDVLIVTTEEVASCRSETHVYDISALTDSGMAAEIVAEAIQATIRPSSWESCRSCRSSSNSNRPVAGRSRPSDRSNPDAGGIAAMPTTSGKLPGELDSKSLPGASKQETTPCQANGDSACVRGAIMPLADALIITQSPLVHRDILGLLRQLERLAAK